MSTGVDNERIIITLRAEEVKEIREAAEYNCRTASQEIQFRLRRGIKFGNKEK